MRSKLAVILFAIPLASVLIGGCGDRDLTRPKVSHPILPVMTFMVALHDRDLAAARGTVVEGVDADPEVREVFRVWAGKIPPEQAQVTFLNTRSVIGKGEVAEVTSSVDAEFRLRLPLTRDRDGTWYLTHTRGRDWLE